MGRKPDFLVTDHTGLSIGIRCDTLNQDKGCKDIAALIISVFKLSMASLDAKGEAS